MKLGDLLTIKELAAGGPGSGRKPGFGQGRQPGAPRPFGVKTGVHKDSIAYQSGAGPRTTDMFVHHDDRGGSIGRARS